MKVGVSGRLITPICFQEYSKRIPCFLRSISLLAYASMQYKLPYECPVKTDTKALLNFDTKALSKSIRKPC